MAHPRKHLVFTLALTVLGNICLALSAHLFLLPSGLPTGGTTGIALAVQAFTGIPVSAFVLAFNVAMLLLGLMVLGRQFAATTVLSSFLYPLALEVFDRLLGDVVLTQDLMLNTVFYGVGVGVSLGMVIRAGASTGGMDIVGRLLRPTFPNFPIGRILMVIDIITVALAGLVFRDLNTTLYSAVTLYVVGIAIDGVV